MLAKFLVVEEATSIAPHSTAKVKLKDAGTSNVGFIFPTVEFAARGLILANAGLLLGPAEARVYNTKDVNQNISAGDCIAMNVQMENEGLKGGELQDPATVEENAENAATDEAVATETNESSENPNGTENTTEESTGESTETVEGNETDEKLEGSTETEESTESNSSESAEVETDEAPKKTSRSRK